MMEHIIRNVKAAIPRVAAFLFAALLSFTTTPVSAHEYWVEPLRHEVVIGKKVLANLRNGEDFSGVSFPRLPDELVSVTLSRPADVTVAPSSTTNQTVIANSDTASSAVSIEIEGRMGDFPAIHFTPSHASWHLVTVQTKPQSLTYTSLEKFQGFIDNHELHHVTTEHPSLLNQLERGRNVQEEYTRYAKSLVLVTHNDQNLTALNSDDKAAKHTVSNTINRTAKPKKVLADSKQHWTYQALTLEWVIDQLPTASTPLILTLLHEGQRVAKRQVEVYKKHDKMVTRQDFMTDKNGQIELTLTSPGTYLINSVRASLATEGDSTLQTDWATLTVAVPKI